LSPYQRITVTTPVACIAPDSGLGATATSAKKATGAKLALRSLAFYIGKGIKQTRHEKRGNKNITVTSYSPNAVVHHLPAKIELSVAGRTAGTYTLTVTFSYQKRVRKGTHKTLVKVVKTLRVAFSVC
jgi:hypothetical protein